ncbi:MAG TPA: lactonase family protein [Bryobacteraceae bacterium]|nr:lactonase family protein [Bryobacteraceae bacterium]
MRFLRSLSLLAAACTCLPTVAAGANEFLVYVGTYTRQNSKGIYAWRFDAGTGKLTSLGLEGETSNPSFLAVSPNHRFLYAVNENNTFEGQPAGSVTAFSINAETGALKQLNQVSTVGPGPCHVAVDKSGKWVFVANYGGGSVAAYPVQEDGSLGKASTFVQHTGSSANPQRQKRPYGHSANPSPDGRFVLVADLGLDQVLTYPLDKTKGMLDKPSSIARIEPGSGPRHLAFDPKGKFAYLASEMAATVTAFSYDSGKGELHQLQTISMLPPDFTGTKAAAEIAVHPSGKFVYASNRGHDSIVIYSVDPSKGTLTAVDYVPTQGKNPRNFAIDPTGNYLFAANQDTANVVVFRIDTKTGRLTPTGDRLDVPFPVCVAFSPAR